MARSTFVHIVFGLAVWVTAPGSSIAATFTELYPFTGGRDGANPASALVSDLAGNIYGTASGGGLVCAGSSSGCGTVYRLDSAGKQTPLHLFSGPDGQSPVGLSFTRGTLYGNTGIGGASGLGSLFSIKPDGSGFLLMHSFAGKDGYVPTGNVLQARNGGRFGITFYGGASFKSTTGPSQAGKGVLFFQESGGRFHVLHSFAGGSDGKYPNSLISDEAGNIFGTTESGGACNSASGCGVVFEYRPSTKTYSTIYTFANYGIDGSDPKLGAAGPDGTLYGAAAGGAQNTGTLFSLTPSAHGYSFTLLADLPKLNIQDRPTNPPSLAKNGDLVGATGYDFYGYANGHISVLGRVGTPPLLPTTDAQFLIGPNATLYGVSRFSAPPCNYVGGFPDPNNGCGYIFSYQLR